MNDKGNKLECSLHPYAASVILIDLDLNKFAVYSIKSVCCERFRSELELYLDRHK